MIKNSATGSQQRGSYDVRILRTKERRYGWESGTTAELWFSAVFLSVCWCVSWFPWPVLSPSWLPVSLGVVAPNPRTLVFEFVGIQRSISLCDISCFFSSLRPPQDKMHRQLSLTVGLCTPCQKSKLQQYNRFFFVGS